MSTSLCLPAPGQSLARLAPESPDEAVIRMWLHGRGPHTARAYRQDLAKLRAHTLKPLASIALADLQSFADSLGGADTSRRRTLSCIKSLLRFGYTLGYLPFDVGKALRVPKCRDTLVERILSESEVHRIIASAGSRRNEVLLTVLYASAVRVSEAVSMVWRDASGRGAGQGQITVLGKGGKTRTMMLPAAVWSDLQSLRGDAGDDAPIFRSRQGDGRLSCLQVERIVAAAAVKAGVKKAVTPHWMRHAAASHALDRGAPIHVVQQSLGHASLGTTTTYTHARPGDSVGLYLGL